MPDAGCFLLLEGRRRGKMKMRHGRTAGIKNMLLRARVIVLKTLPFSESDLILRAMKSDGSQMSFIAKGGLRSKKRFPGPVLEPSAFIEAEYRPSKKYLHNLRQAWILKDFPGLRKDYDRLELALYFLRVMAEMSQEGTEDSEEMFHLLGNALEEAQKSSRLDILKLFFQIKALFLQGVLPAELSCQGVLSSHLKSHAGFQLKDEELKALSAEAGQALSRYLTL